jgi:hypothetical protein
MGSTGDYTAVNGFRSFELPGLASDEPPFSTGMREDLLLLSWLIVLLRTTEDGQATFEWAYNSGNEGQDEDLLKLATRTLSTDQVMPSLRSRAVDVAAAISSQVAAEPTKSPAGSSRPASLHLSMGSLTRTSEGGKDEVSPPHLNTTS